MITTSDDSTPGWLTGVKGDRAHGEISKSVVLLLDLADVNCSGPQFMYSAHEELKEVVPSLSGRDESIGGATK